MTDYTPKPGDLVQLKSGGVVMTAASTNDLNGTSDTRTECWLDTLGSPNVRHIPATCIMPAKLEDEPDHDVMQARVDALREAMRKIERLKSAEYFCRALSLAHAALVNDDLLNDEETEES